MLLSKCTGTAKLLTVSRFLWQMSFVWCVQQVDDAVVHHGTSSKTNESTSTTAENPRPTKIPRVSSVTHTGRTLVCCSAACGKQRLPCFAAILGCGSEGRPASLHLLAFHTNTITWYMLLSLVCTSCCIHAGHFYSNAAWTPSTNTVIICILNVL